MKGEVVFILPYPGCRETYSEMKNETVKNLSNLVKDKELEINSLTEKNSSLLQILQKGTSTGDLEQKCSLLETENLTLREEMRRVENDLGNSGFSAKDNIQHTNELLYLKGRIAELEKKLGSVGTGSKSKLISDVLEKEDIESMEKNGDISRSDSGEAKKFQQRTLELETKVSELTAALTAAHEAVTKAQADALKRDEEKKSEMSEKSLEYMSECERLRTDMKTLAEDRSSLEARLRSRETEVKELHREVKSMIDKKKWVEGEVERLRAHLVQVEEGYTQELMQGEEREQELRIRVGKLEDQVKKASLSHTEASQEASEATSHLTEALTSAAASRDSLTEQLRVSQTKLREKTSALRNLQLALEGFQKQVTRNCKV